MSDPENAPIMPPAACDVLPVDRGEHLKALIEQLIKERQFEGVALLFTSRTEASRNLECLPAIAMDLYNEVCLKHMTQLSFERDPPLFACAEELLKTLAMYAPAELLLELLELVEENESDEVFTSALRAMQVLLLRPEHRKTCFLEWSLDSVLKRFEGMPCPAFLVEGYDQQQEALLEQNDQIQSFLMHCITVGLFYEPILEDLCRAPPCDDGVFRSYGNNSRNVMCFFLLGMLGNHLSLLDLSCDETKKTNTYSRQCARALTQGITKCIGNPMFLLPVVERQTRWKQREEGADLESQKRNEHNVFLNDRESMLDGCCIYYYMVLVEGVDVARIPLVYNPLYIFEMSLYLVKVMLDADEAPLPIKGMRLMTRMLAMLRPGWQLTPLELEVAIYKDVCGTICNLTAYSAVTHLRQHGIEVLRQFIMAFDDEGKYLVLKNLLKNVNHQGICGYLATIYKDLVQQAMQKPDPLPKPYSGADFRSIFLQNICTLTKGIETDLIDYNDSIISALNVIRFFALIDKTNRTGFWSFAEQLEKQFLQPLRRALDFSEAHYKEELRDVHEGRDVAAQQNVNLLDINVGNEKAGGGKLDVQLNKEHKVKVIGQHLCTFDLMRSLLGRTSECLEQQGPSDQKGS